MDSGCYIDISLQTTEEKVILKNINEGFRAEIIYSVRYHQKNISFLSSLFDKAEQIRTTVQGRVDPLSGNYMITRDGNMSFCSTTAEFIQKFFTCRVELPLSCGDENLIKVECMAAIDVLKRPSPLAMLDPFLISEKSRTDWVSVNAE